MWLHSLMDCRAYNTVDLGSDHRILSCKFRLSLKKKGTFKKKPKWNWDVLKDKQEMFETTLTERLAQPWSAYDR